jgi:hypothetical protein
MFSDTEWIVLIVIAVIIVGGSIFAGRNKND